MAATRRELLSPLARTSLSRVGNTPQEYISPSTKRRVGLTSPAAFLSSTDGNDDEAEKRERRRSKVLEIHRRDLASPGTPKDR